MLDICYPIEGYNVIQISQLITLMNFLLTWILIAGYVGGTNPAASK